MSPQLPPELNDILIACVELVGRAGARNLEFGYLHEDAPIAEAGWWATATYRGAKITAENLASPIEAVEALAVRLLTGAMCNHCKGLVALADDAAFAYFRAHLVDGSEWNIEEQIGRPQCRWRRVGKQWIRGCDGSTPMHKGGNRNQRRGNNAKGRRRHR